MVNPDVLANGQSKVVYVDLNTGKTVLDTGTTTTIVALGASTQFPFLFQSAFVTA